MIYQAHIVSNFVFGRVDMIIGFGAQVSLTLYSKQVKDFKRIFFKCISNFKRYRKQSLSKIYLN